MLNNSSTFFQYDPFSLDYYSSNAEALKAARKKIFYARHSIHPDIEDFVFALHCIDGAKQLAMKLALLPTNSQQETSCYLEVLNEAFATEKEIAEAKKTYEGKLINQQLNPHPPQQFLRR